jgi:hypothetical protein
VRSNGPTIWAMCRTRKGELRRTRLDLSSCAPDADISNDDGRLRCGRGDDAPFGLPRGSYLQSCERARADGMTLRAWCRTRSGQMRPSELYLGQCRPGAGVVNDDGRLTCDR